MLFAKVARSLIVAAFLLGVAVAGHAQQQGTSSPSTRSPTTRSSYPDINPPSDPAATAIESRQAIARYDERQKRLIADTEKLLALATKLQEDVAKTDKNMLSLDVIRRAEEIEKLAHSVKERMKG